MKNFCEFFAGVGLVREGLKSYSWQCEWANDISSDKQQTYNANYGSEHFSLGDIWDIVNNTTALPNDVFLYTASFPCTDLSVAGNRAGLSGKQSGTLNALFDILKAKKQSNNLPTIVLLENVKGFLTSNKGDDVKHTVRELSNLGYCIDIIELDAMDFTAQSRPRVFCVAVLESISKTTMKVKQKNNLLDSWWSYFDEHPSLRSKKIRSIILESDDLNWGLFDISPPVSSAHRLKHIIETDIPLDSNLWWNIDRQNHLYSQMSESHKLKLQNMLQSDEYQFGTVYRRMRKGKSMAELRTDGFAGCLRTPRGGSSKQIVIQAGKGDWKVRLLTPREYARLQGVSDSFILPDNDNKGYFAMGDAVCVPVIEFIAQNILEPVYQQHISANSNKLSSAA